jgi:hypothetical protein
MTTRGWRIAWWACALLLTIPAGMLVVWAEGSTGAAGQVAQGALWFFAGAYIALYGLLPGFMTGACWRVRWSGVVVGALFVALSVAARLFFLTDSRVLVEILRAWIAFGGYIVIHAIEPIQANGPKRNG